MRSRTDLSSFSPSKKPPFRIHDGMCCLSTAPVIHRFLQRRVNATNSRLAFGVITQLIEITDELLDLSHLGELFGEEFAASFFLLLQLACLSQLLLQISCFLLLLGCCCCGGGGVFVCFVCCCDCGGVVCGELVGVAPGLGELVCLAC